MEEFRHNTFAACARFADEMEDFLEGEARPFLVAHAQDCTSCGALLADVQAIRQTAQELPLAEPSRALWAKVRAGLETEGAFVASACWRFSDELEAFPEGEGSPFIAAHARDCAPCGALLADLQAIRQAAHELPQEEPSPSVWAHVRARLGAEGLFVPSACWRFDQELETFFEGEAPPFIVAHARDCARCGTMLSDLEAIRQAARDLPLEEPSRVVWANVRARLEAEGAFGVPVSGWRQVLSWRLLPHAIPLGALAILIVLASALTMPYTNMQRWSGAAGATDSLVASQVVSWVPAVEDRALAHVVTELESSFRANEASMAPDLKATYEKSLVSLDGSIRECLASLQNEPRNTLAHDYLLTAYTRKAEVLSSALEFEGR